MATIFETIAQKVKGIVPQFLDEDKIKTDPQGAQVLESAQRLGEKVKEKLGKPLAESLPAVKTGVFNVFEIISRVAGAAVQRLPGILQVPEEEREPFVPKTGETFMEAIRRQPSFGFEFGERKGVVEAAVEKGPLGGVPFLAPVIGFLSELLLPPYGPKGANIVDDLAKITSKLETKGVLLKGIKEISEKEADDLAVKLAPITDKKLIQAELNAFAESKFGRINTTITPKDEGILYKTEIIGVGEINAIERNNQLQIINSTIKEQLRGRGYGQDLYTSLAKESEKRNLPLVSGTSVSKDAIRVWEKLEDLGYKIKRNPDIKVLKTGEIIAYKKGENVFELFPKTPTAKVLPIEIKTKAPAYKRVLNRGYITTKDSWGNEYVQIRGKVPEIVKEKGVAPHSRPTVDMELNKLSEGAVQPAKLVKIGMQEGFTKTEMLQFQTSKGKDIFVNREYVNLALKEYPNAKFFGSESTKPIALKVGDKTVAVVMSIQEGKFAKEITPTPAVKPTDIGQVPSPKSTAQAKSIEQAVQEVIPKKTPLKAEVSQELANSRILSSLPPDKQIPVTKSIAKEFAEYKKAQEGVRGLWTTIREKVQDSFIRARKLQQQVSKGDPIPENIDIDQARTLFDGRVATRLEDVKEAAKSIDKDIVSTAKRSEEH